MKKALTTEFQTRLWEALKAIERDSQVEIVVVMRPRSADYLDIALIWGILGAWLSFTYLMFAPDLFTDGLVYCLPMIAFALCYALAQLPLVTRLSARKSRLQKNVEIMARAIFQKGGIQHTQAKTGVLVYCSWLEKIAYILPDRGVDMALPAEEWQAIRAGLQQVFASKEPAETLLAQLHKAHPLFARYLPALANDINELPDAMEIDL